MSKKIYIVTSSLDLGGTEQHLLRVLPLLAKKGWDIQLIVFGNHLQLLPAFLAEGIPVIQPLLPSFFPAPLIRIFRHLFTIFFLRKTFRRNPPAIIHFFLPEAYLLGMVAALLSFRPIPTVMSRRCLNYYQKKNKLLRILELWLHRKLTLALANSNQVLGQLHKDEHIPSTRLQLIYNGVDIPDATPGKQQKIREALAIPPQALMLTIVANIIPYKRHIDLIHALGTIKDKLPSPWFLLCVGKDHGLGTALRTEANGLGLQDNIIFTGVREDVSAIFTASDIGILCSEEEGFSNAILEGMAAGIPMVVTNVGGNAEAVLHATTGYVVPPHAPLTLGKAILGLASNPQLRNQFGQAALQRVQGHFSLTRCVDDYDKAYQRLLSS